MITEFGKKRLTNRPCIPPVPTGGPSLISRIGFVQSPKTNEPAIQKETMSTLLFPNKTEIYTLNDFDMIYSVHITEIGDISTRHTE